MYWLLFYFCVDIFTHSFIFIIIADKYPVIATRVWNVTVVCKCCRWWKGGLRGGHTRFHAQFTFNFTHEKEQVHTSTLGWLNFFFQEISSLFRLHLIDQKDTTDRNITKYDHKVSVFFFEHLLFLWWQRWIFSMSSVSHDSSEIIWLCWILSALLTIFVGNVTIFSEVQENSIYFK